MRYCVVIPCFNAEKTIGSVVEQTRYLIEDVIVVDDGSSDRSAEIADEAGAEVVTHQTNRGKGAALLSGFAYAQRRGMTHAVTIDADGQHFPEDLTTLIEASKRQTDALIVGVRNLDIPNVGFGSRFGRGFSNFWVNFETGLGLKDTQCGFRIYPLTNVRALDLQPSHFEWEVEVLVRGSWAGIPIQEMPVRAYYPSPAERVSHYRGFVDSTRISLLHFRLFGRWLLKPLWPMRRLIAE